MARRQADANRRSAFAASGRGLLGGPFRRWSARRKYRPTQIICPRRDRAGQVGGVEGGLHHGAHGWRAAENLGRLVAPSMLAIPEPIHSPGLSPRSV